MKALSPNSRQMSQRQAMLKALAQITLLSITATLRSAAQLENTAEQAISNLCDEAQYLDMVAERYRTKITLANAATKKLLDQAAWELAAYMSHDRTEQAALLALSVHSSRLTADATKINNEATQKLEGQLETLSQHVGALAAARALRTQATPTLGVASGNGGQGSIYSGAAFKCDVQISAKQLESGKCLAKVGTGSGIHNKQLTPETARNAKLTDDDMFTAQTLTATVVGKNPDSSSNTYSAGHCSDNASPNSGGKGLGILTVKASAPDQAVKSTQIYAQPETGNDCKEIDIGDEIKPKSAAAVAYALCYAAAVKTKTLPDPETLDPKSLATYPNFQAIAASLLASPGKILNLADTSEKEKLTDLVKNIYGGDSAAFKTKYINNVNSKPVTFKVGTKMQETTVGAITTTEQLSTALAYYFHQTQRSLQKNTVISKNNDGTKDETEETSDKKNEEKDGNIKMPVCSAILNRTACEKGQNCKWENNA
uniref:Variant surface glycoprotein 1125.2517 n=1 Tax=Trypanosoma brucei TaxID=5691 RepID=A0A1J0R7Y3_9TRYP|nr:variant surface glycoprotein 1125.2517 [Trypanosoma brucei]